jgi:hypothetical protein
MEGAARLEGWPNMRVARLEKWPAEKGVDIVWEAAIDKRGRKRRKRCPQKGVAKSGGGGGGGGHKGYAPSGDGWQYGRDSPRGV